jgi:uncharacterized protein (DUF1697 family)
VPVHVAFLRAINVTGRFIKMSALAGHFHTLGHGNARTYINSGNVIFSTRSRSPDKLAQIIEEGLTPLLGFTSEVFIRTALEVTAVAEKALLLRERVQQSGEVNVAFLREPLSQAQSDQLASLRTALDDFVHEGPQIYWLCLGRQMESKFSNAVLERKLGLRTTFRRVSMLQGLAAELRSEV